MFLSEFVRVMEVLLCKKLQRFLSLICTIIFAGDESLVAPRIRDEKSEGQVVPEIQTIAPVSCNPQDVLYNGCSKSSS